MQANEKSFDLSRGGVLGTQSKVCNYSWIVQDSLVAPMRVKSRLIIPSFMQTFLERKKLVSARGDNTYTYTFIDIYIDLVLV